MLEAVRQAFPGMAMRTVASCWLCETCLCARLSLRTGLQTFVPAHAPPTVPLLQMLHGGCLLQGPHDRQGRSLKVCLAQPVCLVPHKPRHAGEPTCILVWPLAWMVEQASAAAQHTSGFGPDSRSVLCSSLYGLSVVLGRLLPPQGHKGLAEGVVGDVWVVDALGSGR